VEAELVKTVCVIPARGGSKRIPKKNIIDFYGKPLIAWTIEAAKKSGVFDYVLVSTDSEEIAEISRKYGASVPFLRQDKSDEFSPVSEATIASLTQLKDELSLDFDHVVQLMANCPLRDASDIRNAYDNFCRQKAQFQVSFFRFGWMNPWWAFRLEQNGRPSPIFQEEIKMRSQDLPPLYCPTGAIWIAQKAALMASNSFYGPNHILHEIDWVSAVDIDDDQDLRMARAAYLMKHDEQKS
jgi:N-acylneuraminate cytidylyltransferase